MSLLVGISFKSRAFLARMALFIVVTFSFTCYSAEYQSHRIEGNTLVIDSGGQLLRITPFKGEAFEVQVIRGKELQLNAFARSESAQVAKLKIDQESATVKITNGKLNAVVNKKDLSIDFFREGQLLSRQKSYFQTEKKRGFEFALDDKEKVLGGGQRVLGMNRRGHRMPLYNRAHYGYTTESNQMYYSLPAVMSDKKYVVVFDNSASGFLDIGKTDKNTLAFEAVGGRSAYLFIAGKNYPQLIEHYVGVTGKQPLPPRWAFGNYASRFGYRTQKEVIDTIDKFVAEDFPVDAIIIDLYWFGPDIKGHMGHLDWETKAFPDGPGMIAELKEKGVKTILITEPFILSSSSRWQDAVDHKVLAKNARGEPRRFDFYFGNTGLIDVFDEKGEKWFWNIYQELFQQGVAGTWGDLGEPEVHPDDAIHFVSETGAEFRGDEVHNAYGHQWAKIVYENQRKLQPDTRPFIMMRSGIAGSQRYGMIPWTGDVSRSWDGLKPQVELSLQMGLLGLAYNHSDLGGFAGGETFDKEMYIRWLQYGVFQPVYRPHAQDHIPSEPVFHDKQTRDILREFVKLRYQLLPYNYTLAFENSQSGMPLMRPVFFEDEKNTSLFDIKDTYLWGDAFLVSPVTEAGKTEQLVKLPAGVWFDYWTGRRYSGDQSVKVPVDLKKIPVLVRGGSFIPMVPSVQNTSEYSSEQLSLHYYADTSVKNASGQMFEDDGESFDSVNTLAFELLKFNAMHSAESLSINLERSEIGKGYPGMPDSREVSVVIHNMDKAPKAVSFNQQKIAHRFDANTRQLVVEINWSHSRSDINIEF